MYDAKVEMPRRPRLTEEERRERHRASCRLYHARHYPENGHLIRAKCLLTYHIQSLTDMLEGRRPMRPPGKPRLDGTIDPEQIIDHHLRKIDYWAARVGLEPHELTR